MSTLVTQNISNGTVSTSSQNVIQGSAKAWVLWNGSSIDSSYNVSSITNPATGTYTVNFTTAFSSNISFAAIALGQGASGTTDGNCSIENAAARISGSAIQIRRKRSDNNAAENGAFNAAFFGT